MSKSPGSNEFGDSYKYQGFCIDTFDPNDLCKEQAEYLAKQSEVTTLAALFVSRMAQRKVWCRNTLKEAGLFFTRSAEILNEEVQQEQKRTETLETTKAPTPRAEEKKATMETDSFRPKREEFLKGSPPKRTVSVESLHSGFVTESTSASTMRDEEVPAPRKATLKEFMHQLVLNFMDTGLNNMYTTRVRDIIYDEAHLCIMSSIQVAVETKWNPIIDDFNELLEMLVDDVRRTALQRYRMKLRAIDKVPIKVQRLRNNFKGFSTDKNPPPTREQILETIKKRKWRYNRYLKDAFGVYISSEKGSSKECVTSESEEYELCTFNSLDSITPSYASTSTCQPIVPIPIPHTGIQLPILRSIIHRPPSIVTNPIKEKPIVSTQSSSSEKVPNMPILSV